MSDLEPPNDRLPHQEFAESRNPYAAPVVDAIVLPDDDGNAPTGITTTARLRPRSWTSFLVVGVCGICFLAASIVLTFLAVFLVHGTVNIGLLQDESILMTVMGSRIGLFVLVVLPQLALVLPAIVAAIASPVPITRRLGLVRGQWPIWTWIAVAMATPLVGMGSSVVVGSFMQESESLKELSSIFRMHGEAGFMIPLALMIGLTPAFCEELVFRGYMQTRLTQSMGPFVGIAVASLLFASFHMDFVHVIAVLPLGLFLGWVTWRSGSLFPAMLGHFVNNAISVVLAVNAPEDQMQMLSIPTLAFMAGVFACGAAGMAATCYAAVYYRHSETLTA